MKMRISEYTMAYFSIIWFACDVTGRLIVANSDEGLVPEFVAENLERAELLANRLCGLNSIDRQRTPPIDYNFLADKGFYCFVNDDPYDSELYQLWAKPTTPLVLDDLEKDIRELLSAQMLPIDLADCNCFRITK